MTFQTLMDAMLRGSLTVIELFFLVLIFAIPLGMIITFLVKCRFKLVKYLFEAYIYLFRGTPLLLQLFIVWTGLPMIPGIGQYLMFESRFAAACVTFILNYAAYFAEIFRGGLLAVDKGQYEAARVLGFNRVQTFFHIIFPQMFRVFMPSLTNDTITLVKDTSLAHVLGVTELLYRTQNLVNTYARPMSTYLCCIIIYLIMTTVVTFVMKKLEQKYSFQ